MFEPSSNETFVDVVNYVLSFFNYPSVYSVYDTTHSRVVAEELKRAYIQLANESDWQEHYRDTRLDSLNITNSAYTCGGATGYQLTGSTSRIDSVWDVKTNTSVKYLDYSEFQLLCDTDVLYATCDIDWITCDNDYLGFRDYELKPEYFTFYDNSIFLNPNLNDVVDVKVTRVVKPEAPQLDYDRFSLTEELMDVLKSKALSLCSMRLQPELYTMLETSYQQQARTSRQRLNHYPNRAKRSVL